jgi:hypothetical protein
MTTGSGTSYAAWCALMQGISAQCVDVRWKAGRATCTMSTLLQTTYL